MSRSFQIVAVNPGSTSTKLAVFDGEQKRFAANVEHPPEELARFPEIIDQLDYRKEAILSALQSAGVDLTRTAAFSGRCTGLLPMEGGVYEVNDLMYRHGRTGPGSRHPGNLGPVIVRDFADRFGGRSFVVDPSSVDELCPEARLTGLGGMFRSSRGHPLNQRAAAMRYAERLGRSYREMNLVVAHLGGGISIGAHRRGRMIEMVDSTRGEGRMAPTRTGGLPAASVVELCFSGRYTRRELLDKIMKTGGWLDLLGTSDAREVERRIDAGDRLARLVLEATAYQTAKDIAACAAALCGAVDGVLLTGGLANDARFVELIRDRVLFIAPVTVFPGEFEMEGLAAGALRVLTGEEAPRSYTGEPVFQGLEKLAGEEPGERRT